MNRQAQFLRKNDRYRNDCFRLARWLFPAVDANIIQVFTTLVCCDLMRAKNQPESKAQLPPTCVQYFLFWFGGENYEIKLFCFCCAGVVMMRKIVRTKKMAYLSWCFLFCWGDCELVLSVHLPSFILQYHDISKQSRTGNSLALFIWCANFQKVKDTYYLDFYPKRSIKWVGSLQPEK